MNPKIARLETPEECDNVIENTSANDPDFAAEARAKKVQLLAISHEPDDECVQDCWAALFAYEQILLNDHGKNVKANRTRQKIAKVGMLPAVEHWVRLDAGVSGYQKLKQLGLLEHTFEAVVVKHPSKFSAEAVEISRKKLVEINAT